MRERIIDKITSYVSKYLNTKVVYIADLFLSTLASLLVVLSSNAVERVDTITSPFVLFYCLASLVFSLVAFYCFGTYKVVIRHFAIRDLFRFLAAIIVKDGLLTLFAYVFPIEFKPIYLVWMIVADALFTMFMMVGTRIVMIMGYDIFLNRLRERQSGVSLLVYGTSLKSVAALSRFSESLQYNILGFISTDTFLMDYEISGRKIYVISSEDELQKLSVKLGLNGILFATDKEAKKEQNGLIQYASHLKLKVFLIPVPDELREGQPIVNPIRKIQIEDLLGRNLIQISCDSIRSAFQDKVVLITGAAGSVGSEICRQLARFQVKQIILFDNAETPLHNLRLELSDSFPRLSFVSIVGDVRGRDRLSWVFNKYAPQVVFHAAAYKHVPLMEENPCEAIRVNVLGSKNIADLSLEYGIEMMVMISTDKAVNPTNIMGCSKRLAEIYVQSLGLSLANGEKGAKGRIPKFVTTRFGNVLGSNGSVVPRFRSQIERGGPVTVTDPRMIRYFMTIPEACLLVLEASVISVGNQIVVFDMGDPVKIDDLARRMITLSGLTPDVDIKIEYTGLRPGEKLFEEVLASEENTDPTSHNRIRVARVRSADYNQVEPVIQRLLDYAFVLDIDHLVPLMKQMVPEFKSEHSIFEKYDK